MLPQKSADRGDVVNDECKLPSGKAFRHLPESFPPSCFHHLRTLS